jgi:hypothetical protein
MARDISDRRARQDFFRLEAHPAGGAPAHTEHVEDCCVESGVGFRLAVCRYFTQETGKLLQVFECGSRAVGLEVIAERDSHRG